MTSHIKLSHSGRKTCFPVIDGVLHLNYGHVTEGVSENTHKKNKLALMGFLHVAASVMVEFYSTCLEI